MEDYTKEDVLKELSSLDQSTRKRNLVDQRSYLIGILYQKFGLPEHTIAKLTGLKREKVNYNRRLPIQFKDDAAYKKNVYVYAQLFPFDFSKSYAIKSQRQRTIQIVVEVENEKKAWRCF
jgi:hypothetical protein